MRIATVLLFLLVLSTFGGCSVETVDSDNTGERFYCAIDRLGNDVYVDGETGVMYFFRKQGYVGGLTVMVDKDGKPLIWERN